MSPLIVNTAFGYLFPLAVLFYVRWRGNAFHYVALSSFALYMATVGMGKLLPFFGHSVVGGSFYFPVALLSMTLLGYHSGDPKMLRRISGALIVGSVFLCGGVARWVIFSIYGGVDTTHSYNENFALWYASLVMILKCYLATMIGIYTAHWRPKNEGWIVLPIILEVIVTTPLVLHCAWTLNPDRRDAWGDVIFWTYFCRLSFVMVAGVCLTLLQRWFGEVHVRDLSEASRVTPPAA